MTDRLNAEARPDQYVTVTAREWAIYIRARSAAREVLHSMFFYSGRARLAASASLREDGKHKPYMREGAIVLDVVHPMPVGDIPEGYAVAEAKYRSHTVGVRRSAQSVAKTSSHMRGLALS